MKKRVIAVLTAVLMTVIIVDPMTVVLAMMDLTIVDLEMVELMMADLTMVDPEMVVPMTEETDAWKPDC